MIISTLFTVTGAALILSGIRSGLRSYVAARALPTKYPRWTILDNQKLGRAGARARVSRAKLRYHLVAVNTALECLDTLRYAHDDVPRSRKLESMRATLERMVYGGM